MVHSLNSIVQVLPSMLGTESHANDAPRNYLILAQTNAEARPSGGLTGSLGLVTVQGGHVSLQPFVSDSEIQNADEPVVDLTAEERLLFTDKLGKDIRDVNFTPDFPRTGEIVSAMWNRQYGVAVDGVIAIDPLFLQNMLAVTGGVVMPDGSTLDGRIPPKRCCMTCMRAWLRRRRTSISRLLRRPRSTISCRMRAISNRMSRRFPCLLSRDT